MASRMYPSAKDAILNKLIDMDTDDIRLILIDTADYTYSGAHDFLDDVAAGARVATSAAALAGRTLTSGVFDASDLTLPSVTGDPCEAFILYLHTGTEGTSRLICYVDGFTVTPDGNDILIQFHASGIVNLADV